MKSENYSMMDWSEKHKSPMVESYQPKEREFAGEQNQTLNYVERRDRIQTQEASMIRNHEYKGRYQ